MGAVRENSASRRAGKTGPPVPQSAELRRLRKATGDFEALFLSKLLKPLEKATERTSSGNNLGGGVMMGVALEKMAETLATQGGIGLGELLYESMRERIGAAGNEPAVSPDPNTTRSIPIDPESATPEFFPVPPLPVKNTVGSPVSQPINKVEGETVPNSPSEPIEQPE